MLHEVAFTLNQRMELFVIVIFFTAIDAQESKLEGPQNTLSVVGSNVILKCSSSYRKCNGIDWQKYVPSATPVTVFKGPRTILNTNVTDRDRYSVDNSSGCDLVITNVTLRDAGRFICSAIISSSQTTKTAYLIALETQPKCTLNESLDETVEGDGVRLNCEITYDGTNKTSMNWKGVTDDPVTVQTGNTINRPYSFVASEPEVPSFTCVTSFAFETVDNGKPINGSATNSIPNATCSTPAIKVLYSVRDVTVSPSSSSSYPPGTVITCTARGHPSPTFKWQEMENGSIWIDTWIGSEFTMTHVSSKRYRCVAMNVVKGQNYNATSIEIPVNNTESDSTGTTTTNIALQYTMMAVAAGILLIVIVLIICFCNETCLGYKCYNSAKKSKDNLRYGQPLRENPDVCTYSVVDKGQDIHPKAKSPKRPKGPPPQPKTSNADAYQNEECTYADLAMEYGPRKLAPQNGQAAQEESVYAAVSMA